MSRKEGKFDRRKKEILKAQAKSSMRFDPAYMSEGDGLISKDQNNPVKKDSQRLNISLIKTDLIKTALYIVFTLAVLYILKTYPLQLNLGIYK